MEIPENIDRLIAKSFFDSLNKEEQARLDQWLESDKENILYYQSLVRLNTNSSTAPAFDTENAWTKLKGRIDKESPNSGGSKPWGFFLRVAALLAVVVTLGYYAFWQSEHAVVVAEAETVEQTLDDGTQLALNESSEVRTEFTNTQRKVKMKGEVFFDVARDESKPFVIETPSEMNVWVLGTSFNINAKLQDSTIVSVSSGRVLLISPTADSLVLEKGDEAIYIASLNGFVKQMASPNAMAWKTKKLVFDNVRFDQVLPVLSSFYGIEITGNEDFTTTCHLTATFSDEPLDVVLEVITASHDVQIDREKDSVKLMGEGCGDAI